jgi:hypothetical protein
MPCGLVLKDERRTSNTERPTPNENKYQLPNIEHLFLFLHLFPFNVRCWTFDVRCSFFVPPGQKQFGANQASRLLECWNIGLMGSGRMEFDCFTCPDSLTVLSNWAWRCFLNLTHIMQLFYIYKSRRVFANIKRNFP